MKIEIIPAEKQHRDSWSGGTTTELFIYPRTAEYKKFDFKFRLSMATVEVDTSVFTPLPGISRTLLLLEGAMKLVHKNQHTTELRKFDFDVFEGEWRTESFGQCTDFNLMTIGAQGTLQGVRVGQGNSYAIASKRGDAWIVIFAYKGELEAELDGLGLFLNEGDLLVIQGLQAQRINLTASVPSELVCCMITE